MNSKENYFQSGKPAQLRQIRLLTGFSFVTAALMRRIAQTALLTVFLLLQFAAVETALAQTQELPIPKTVQTDDGIVQVFEAPITADRSAETDLFKPRKTGNIFSSNVESLLTACHRRQSATDKLFFAV